MDDRRQALADAGSVLVLASPMDPRATEACMELLARDDPRRTNVLNVLFTRRPDRRVENWRRHVGDLPDRFEVLGTQVAAESPGGARVETLGRPGDLTGIGVAIVEHLARWDGRGPGALCLHSITAQLQYASAERVYQFLAALLSHLSREGVFGHAHMNPGAHDVRTVETFKTLFDAVVEVEEGEVSVTTR